MFRRSCFFLPVLGVCLASFFLLVPDVYASMLELAPQKFTLQSGKTTNVQIKVDTEGEYVNAVTVVISYPPDQLEAVWLDYNGSAFPLPVEAYYGGGKIRLTRGSLSGVRGILNVATVSFKGEDAGSGAVSFTSGSQVPRLSDSSDSLNLPGSPGGTFTVTAASAQPTPTAPNMLISDLAVTPLSTDSAIVSWRTQKSADSLVQYGLEAGKYILSVADPALTLDHRIKLQSFLFTPGRKLHLQVTSKDKSGNVGDSADTIYQVGGFEVIVNVVDGNNNPIKGAEVLIYSTPSKAVTDEQGEADFTNLSPGTHLVLVKYGDFEKSGEIMITG